MSAASRTQLSGRLSYIGKCARAFRKELKISTRNKKIHRFNNSAALGLTRCRSRSRSRDFRDKVAFARLHLSSRTRLDAHGRHFPGKIFSPSRPLQTTFACKKVAILIATIIANFACNHRLSRATKIQGGYARRRVPLSRSVEDRARKGSAALRTHDSFIVAS